MKILQIMKGAFNMIVKALVPQKKSRASILGQKKYGSSFSKTSILTSRSILGMAKFNQDSGVMRDVKKFDNSSGE